MSQPDYPPLMTVCCECGKEVDLFEANKYMALGANSPDDPTWCEDCYFKSECANCQRDVPLSKQLVCSCWKEEGLRGHEELVFCSEKCRDKAHHGWED